MARFTEWTPALERALAEPFPKELVQQKRKGGSSIDFVAWHHYVRRLNDLVGSGWSMGEPVFKDVGGKLMVALPVTILGCTRVNFGSEDEEKDDYGDAATNSFAQAFKRTCALFGLGLSMYDKGGVAERAEHVGLLDSIKAIGARCDDDVEFLIRGKTEKVVGYVRSHWTQLKADRQLAQDVATALRESLGTLVEG